ncbi:hypothetical protein EDD52_10845 [Primorskyibacter sedentarius]|uniref:Uncharacterized protein n=1 Tax=Primorskyibacter sedentarius TaxID=745311 RepID=A0A4V2UNN5_9RHOB|nr:hypothetical protein EDD52_10845 [Primorskyibacter sedentarius]
MGRLCRRPAATRDAAAALLLVFKNVSFCQAKRLYGPIDLSLLPGSSSTSASLFRSSPLASGGSIRPAAVVANSLSPLHLRYRSSYPASRWRGVATLHRLTAAEPQMRSAGSDTRRVRRRVRRVSHEDMPGSSGYGLFHANPTHRPPFPTTRTALRHDFEEPHCQVCDVGLAWRWSRQSDGCADPAV